MQDEACRLIKFLLEIMTDRFSQNVQDKQANKILSVATSVKNASILINKVLCLSLTEPPTEKK